jgi:hypothetical protein
MSHIFDDPPNTSADAISACRHRANSSYAFWFSGDRVVTTVNDLMNLPVRSSIYNSCRINWTEFRNSRQLNIWLEPEKQSVDHIMRYDLVEQLGVTRHELASQRKSEHRAV